MAGWDGDGMARGRMGMGWNAKQRDVMERNLLYYDFDTSTCNSED